MGEVKCNVTINQRGWAFLNIKKGNMAIMKGNMALIKGNMASTKGSMAQHETLIIQILFNKFYSKYVVQKTTRESERV